MSEIRIEITGPAASGRSSIAKLLESRFLSEVNNATVTVRDSDDEDDYRDLTLVMAIQRLQACKPTICIDIRTILGSDRKAPKLPMKKAAPGGPKFWREANGKGVLMRNEANDNVVWLFDARNEEEADERAQALNAEWASRPLLKGDGDIFQPIHYAMVETLRNPNATSENKLRAAEILIDARRLQITGLAVSV